MTAIEQILIFIRQKAEMFGANNKSDFNKSYMERNNTKSDALQDNGAYFGFIHPDEEPTGPFHDFSFTIFPSSDEKPWLICLGIGSLGFKNDFELSTIPGLRRMFSKLVDSRGFCKSDFSDIESNLPRSISENSDLEHIKKTIKTYSKVLPVCQIIDNPLDEKGKLVISAFLAGYAKLRDWPTNQQHRKSISEALSQISQELIIDEQKEILELIKERKYLVLQGPPGTGKTRAAKKITRQLNAKSFFTQFHAETSYSDFIYGIRPTTNSSNLSYKEQLGIFPQALKHAINSNENTLLIIDEINRANLSNVLGPIFYLFEYQMEENETKIEIYPGFEVSKLPENFFVIATMNTADRSLAVVDFALRRRFAWYSMKPRTLNTEHFFEKDFLKFQEIFHWFSNSNELNLQPGQGYFIAPTEESMEKRIRYELLPLIKEYLQEGLLNSTKEEFNTYFESRIGVSLFE